MKLCPLIAIYHAWLCLASMKLPKGSATGHEALCIEEPVDPKLHDILLGSSSGEGYSARGLAAKNENLWGSQAIGCSTEIGPQDKR
jgi:hypothetical protein